jgi:hypothetical protein
MRGTKPAGESQYGDANTLHPGRRCKIQKFDTSIGVQDVSLTDGVDTILVPLNDVRAEVADLVLSERGVASRETGLASTEESGGQVLSLEIVSGGSGYSFSSPTANTATTGGNGKGLTINYTRTSGVVTAVAIGNSAGRAYTVGDLVTSTLTGGTGVSVRVTAVA